MIKDLYSVLDARGRRQVTGVWALTLINSLLEAVGIGILFPFFKLVSEPKTLHDHALLERAYQFLALDNERQFIVAAAIAICLVLYAKNLLYLLATHLKLRFINGSTVSLSRRLLRGYLHAPYEFHLKRNSADLIWNLQGAVTKMFDSAFQGMIELATEAVVILGIVVILMMADPVVTLFTFSLVSGVFAVFYATFRKRMEYYGAQSQKLEKLCLKTLQQTFGSIKEIKILNRQDYFERHFTELVAEIAEIRRSRVFLTSIPRPMIEIVTVTAMILTVLYVLSTGRSGTEIIALLGLFGVAAFRMMPSLGRVVMALNNIKTGKPAVKTVMDDYHMVLRQEASVHAPEGPDMTFEKGLEVQDVTYVYPDTDKRVLDNVTLNLPRHASVALVGPSGAGKTTLADVILGIHPPTGGQVLADGRDIAANPQGWQRRFGYVPQQIYLLDDSLRRNVAFGLDDDQIDDDRVRAALDMAQLSDVVAEMPDGLDSRVGESGSRFSGGQRQRLGIARALYPDPDIIIMDEATSALDAETEVAVTKVIHDLSRTKTILIIAHRLSTVSACDRLYYMEDGRVTGEGTFTELCQDNPSFARMVRLAELMRDEDGAPALT
ncbi:MAG: ABC transporter ATP-binding protein [Rhodobacterales bacterium]|nr:ABC transporter ATP-binding protein [Rhodobacterales bacterium]